MGKTTDLKEVLIQASNVTNGRISRVTVFSDFLAYCALRMSNRTDPVHYEDRIKQAKQLETAYTASELQIFQDTLEEVCAAVKRNIDRGDWTDLFGDAYIEIGAGNRALKQDFTPQGVARLMAMLTAQNDCTLPECGYFTLSDHACGSGVLLLSNAERLSSMGFNPSVQLVVQAADMDIRCVHMTYLNLSLYGIPAVVIRGNTITLEEYDRWYTPVYLMHKWVWKEPLLFGNGGYKSNELLKRLDEPIYRALKLLLQEPERPKTGFSV